MKTRGAPDGDPSFEPVPGPAEPVEDRAAGARRTAVVYQPMPETEFEAWA